jgi:hypothetical protein
VCGKPFYDVRVDRVEGVQRRFIRYALRGLGWADMHDLPPYEDICALLHLDTFAKRRSVACVMFIFDVLSELARLVVRSQFDCTTTSESRYRVSAY